MRDSMIDASFEDIKFAINNNLHDLLESKPKPQN
jgi:hypothetical protein